MSTYQGVDNYTPVIYLVETTDPVLGGASGIENQDKKELADRTTYLYNRIGRQKDVAFIGIGAEGQINTYPNTDLLNNQTIVILHHNYGEIIIDETASLPNGSVLKFHVIGGTANIDPPGNVVKLKFTNHLVMKGYDRDYVYLYVGENIELVKWQDVWYITQTNAPLTTVGTPFYGYKIMPGTLFRDGSLLLRKKYPRLFDFVTSLGSSPYTGYWNDATWNGAGNAGMLYKGGFSGGDGTTTFRIPDDRGMFERAIDGNTGVDPDRSSQGNGNYVGRQQQDSFKKHKHKANGLTQNSQTGQAMPAFAYTLSGVAANANYYTELEGGSETHPKNSSKVPLLIF